MRQSRKCGSVRNDEVINLHLGFGASPESACPASCKAPVTIIGSVWPNNQPGENKQSKNEIQLPINRILLPWSTYTEPRTKNAAPREVVNKSTSRNKEETPKRKQVVSYSLDSHMDPGNLRCSLGTKCSERNQEDQSPSEPLLIVSKLLSLTVSPPNLTQINQGRPYQIVSNLRKVWPNPQIICSSAYQDHLL